MRGTDIRTGVQATRNSHLHEDGQTRDRRAGLQGVVITDQTRVVQVTADVMLQG